MPALFGRLCFAALLALHSTGCQSVNSTSAIAADEPPAARTARADALVADLSRSGATRQQRLLTAASLYLSAQDYAKAIDTLNNVDTRELPRDRRGDFLVTLASAHLESGDVAGAARVVARAPEGRFAFVDDLTAGDFARVAERRAAILERRGAIGDAIRERVAANRQLAADIRKPNEDALWTLLMRAPHDALRQLEKADDADTRGWAGLARLYRDNSGSASLLASQIDGWLAAHPQHAAGERPPLAIQKARGASPGDSPSQVAVLLPLHGKLAGAGVALQRGILAAWFQARENGAQMPPVRFYDSSRSDFMAVYDSAVSDGARLVIGPLEKEHLRVLQLRDRLPVTTIALNYPDAPGGPSGLYYFGLATEDEAAQLARAAVAKGWRRVAVLHPAGDWGQRVAEQVRTTLQQNDASLRASAAFQGNGDYNEVVRRLLDIGASEARHGRLERLLGTHLGFQPNHRQDIDCLIIVANTLQATQIVPAVQYQHAGGLPLLATSQVNSQHNTTSANDLAGIRFVEMPWIAEPGHPLRERVAEAWKDVDERYLRLYALGIDAWRLGQQLPLLAESTAQRLDGTTGVLSLDTERRVHRELTWMVFRDGRAEPAHAGD